MLELAILGLLESRELHGYEIRKLLRDELGLLSNVSFGSLYPALARLERQGAVEAVEEQPPGPPRVPMTGSLSGERAALRARRPPGSRSRRSRKVYRITEIGHRQFAELLEAESSDSNAEDSRSFGLRLALARYLPPQARIRLLERRRAQMVQRLAQARSASESSIGLLDDYARSLVEHARESAEREIAWLDTLIEREHERMSSAAGSARRANRKRPSTEENAATAGTDTEEPAKAAITRKART